jgi:hypothetical protein
MGVGRGRDRMIDLIANGTSTAMLVMLVYLLWSGQIVRRTVRQKRDRDESLRRYLIAEGFDPYQAEIIVGRTRSIEHPSTREYPVLSLDEDESTL